MEISDMCWNINIGVEDYYVCLGVERDVIMDEICRVYLCRVVVIYFDKNFLCYEEVIIDEFLWV